MGFSCRSPALACARWEPEGMGEEDCHLLRKARMMMVTRLSSAAMMGIPTLLKVSSEVRGLPGE